MTARQPLHRNPDELREIRTFCLFGAIGAVVSAACHDNGYWSVADHRCGQLLAENDTQRGLSIAGETQMPAATERARRLVIRAQMGFGSAGATKGTTGFRIDTKREYETAQHVWAQYPASIEALGNRMTGVLIENRPAVDVIQAHDDRDTLFYVDPPYVHDTRCCRLTNNGKAYRHEMTDADHQALLDALQDVAGMVVLSGYPHPLYDEALTGWVRHDKRARISGGRGTALRAECIWINPSCQRARKMVQMSMDLARA